jgi:transposase
MLFVLYTGIRWEFLRQELGFGSGMTCWRRLRDWNEAGVWQQLPELLLAERTATNRTRHWASRVESAAILMEFVAAPLTEDLRAGLAEEGEEFLVPRLHP